jgi:DNA repair protein RecO (recombination protein O)
MSKRVHDEPAYVLHRYDWSESSLVLEVFSRHHGRVVLVAKGAKRPTSQLRPVLLPLQPLRLSWGGDAEVRTLRTAQWVGGHIMPTGDALLAGSYLNELLLRLLARDDAHPRLFDDYALAVQWLAERRAAQPLILRAFELVLLRETGFLPDLGREGSSLQPLEPERSYVLQPEAGLRPAHADDVHALAGREWLALESALAEPTPMLAAMRASLPAMPALRAQLRGLLHYHSGVRVFRTRQLMLDAHALARPRPDGPEAPARA